MAERGYTTPPPLSVVVQDHEEEGDERQGYQACDGAAQRQQRQREREREREQQQRTGEGVHGCCFFGAVRKVTRVFAMDWLIG